MQKLAGSPVASLMEVVRGEEVEAARRVGMEAEGVTSAGGGGCGRGGGAGEVRRDYPQWVADLL